MPNLIGACLAATCLFAAAVGWDRDRVFYPVLLTAIATWYILFAVM